MINIITPKRVLVLIISLTFSMLMLAWQHPGVKALSANLIPNPSVEIPDLINPAIPQNWVSNSWGSNTATFSYLNDGQDGLRSVYVKITNYANGDAKWYFNAIPAAANTPIPTAQSIISGWQRQQNLPPGN